MTLLCEGNIELRIPPTAVGKRFDDASHGLSHCMKAVDFVVELPDRIYFIEFKDPDSAPPLDRQSVIVNYQSGSIDGDLVAKLRDSWLYEWSANRLRKSVYYLVLLAAESLSSDDLARRTAALKLRLPIGGPSDQRWSRPYVAGCSVLNITSWNRVFRDFPLKRLS